MSQSSSSTPVTTHLIPHLSIHTCIDSVWAVYGEREVDKNVFREITRSLQRSRPRQLRFKRALVDRRNIAHLQRLLNAPSSTFLQTYIQRLSLPACRWSPSTSHLLTGCGLTYKFESSIRKPTFVLALDLVGEPCGYGVPIEIVDSILDIFKARGTFQKLTVDGLNSPLAFSSDYCIPMGSDISLKLLVNTRSLVLRDMDFAEDYLSPLYQRTHWA